MRRVMLLLLFSLFTCQCPCSATDKDNEELLSFISRTPQTLTQVKITTLLGQPGRIEESKKHTFWYYTAGTSSLTISWNNKTELPERFSFTSVPAPNSVFDRSASRKLKSGYTDITQAVKILGTPKNMTIKASTQVLHYAYQNKMLRLFFRDSKLVDFCLY